MILISVNDEVMVNPDMISTIELRGSGESKKIIVRIGNKDITIKDHKQFFKDLDSHGITSDGQFVRS